MQHPDYNSPSALKSFMESQNMAMQKKFGQNFMVNPAARSRIVDELELTQGSTVWEIGPGLGCMTEEILSKGADVTVFEIDRGFIGLLHQFFEESEKKNKFRIVEGDCLKTWKKVYKEMCAVPADGEAASEAADSVAVSTKKIPDRLFGNLPYNIAATFIADTITAGLCFEKCVFTVQKEVTQRMVAKAGTENYSSFSVLCQWKYNVASGIELAPGNFWPKPNVSSQSVILTRKENPGECGDEAFFVKLVHALFASRRKTIANNIKGILPPDVDALAIFERCGIDKSERAENLSIEKLLLLSRECCSDIMNARAKAKEAR